MKLEGLEVVLYSLSQDFDTARVDLEAGLTKAQSTSAGLDEVQTRLKALAQRLPAQEISLPSSIETPVSSRPQTAVPTPLSQNWQELRHEAERRLMTRGVDLNTIRVDALLDAGEVDSLERRFRGEFSLSTRLDGFDLAAAATAGLVAGLVDCLMVRIPKDIVYLGQHVQAGSPLTQWLHSLSIPADNWLAQYFKTSYDTVKPVRSAIPGFGPKSHRLQTFGHDPLVGLVIGTIDIMRGGLTAISNEGELIFLNDTGAAHYNPFTAIVWQIMHLMSDGFTKMGLPPPGWSLLQLLQTGSFGEKERTIADLARYMYLNGYDSRHFLTMSTSVAAAEIVLRGYFWLRRKLDEDYGRQCHHIAEVIGTQRTSAQPRFQALALAAHATASAANAGKVAIYQGNPLALNYAQWLRFFQAAFMVAQTKMRSPSEILRGYACANGRALSEGWPATAVDDPQFPTLIV